MKLIDKLLDVMQWLFGSKYRPIKYTGAVVFLIAAILATMGALAFTSLTSTAQYQIKGMMAVQQGTNLQVSWDADEDVDGYTVFLQQNGERPIAYETKVNRCQIGLDVLGLKYRVTVTARDDNGGRSAARSRNVVTHKLRQVIETEQEKYVGLKDKHRDIDAEAMGELSFTSSDSNIVTVSKDGLMTYGEDGKAEVTISAEETDQYRAATKTVSIKVYPDVLDTPNMKVADKTDTTVSLKWNPVEYAKGYTLRKYDPAKEKYIDALTVEKEITSIDLARDQAKYKLKATATVGKDEIESEFSKAVSVKSTAVDAQTYGSAHNLGTLDHSNLERICSISAVGRASVPQSMSRVGDNYVVTFVDHGGSVGALSAYSPQGEHLYSTGISGMGYANGSTYNPNTNMIYTVKTHRSYYSAQCTAYHPETGAKERVFNLPRITSGIAYDDCNDKFYLSKGNQVYVCDSDFNVESTLWKRARYHHTQDIGAYNGVALVCTWTGGNQGYIDLYRTSDGAYLGSYNVPIGEIESCFVDNKHLVILMNNGSGGLGDCILRTVEPITLP